MKDGTNGVMIVRYSDGRASGDALVLFDGDRDLDKAMQKNKHCIGSRYVELFLSSLKEFQMVPRAHTHARTLTHSHTHTHTLTHAHTHTHTHTQSSALLV